MNPLDIFSNLNALWSYIQHVQAADDGDPWGIAGLGADGVGTAQALLGKATETPVIEAGLLAIAAFSWMCGFGDSEKGDSFGEGGSKFNDIIDKLKSASPDGTWQGSASDAYAGQNVKQQDRASTMVDADFQMNQIISCEANQLSGTRDILDHAGTVLGYAILPALAAMRIPAWGWEISMGIQLGAVGGTVPVCQAAMTEMALNAIENAKSVRKVTDKYNSANPDPKTRTHEIGLWGAPHSRGTEQSAGDSPGAAPPVDLPNKSPGGQAPTVPPTPAPTVPSSPVPTVPSSPGPKLPSSPTPNMPSGGDAPAQSTRPPVMPASAMPAASSGIGSPGMPVSGLPNSTLGRSSGIGPVSVPEPPATQLAAKPAVPQASWGSTTGERAPIRIGTRTEVDAQSASTAPTRTEENDVR